MTVVLLIRSCQEIFLRCVKGLGLFVRAFASRALSTARRVHKHRPRWKELRPQSRILEEPPCEGAHLFPLRARWLARVLVASRPLGP